MTGCFEAVSLGSAVPRRGFEGTVHSVFRRVVNLRVSGELVLLTLLLSEEADLPQGIRVDARDGLTFEGLSAGARVACEHGVLAVGNSLMVDLRKASIWECDLLPLAVDMMRPTVATAWNHAWHAMQERQAGSGSAIIGADCTDRTSPHQLAMAQHLGQAVRAILRATINCDLDGMPALGGLVGVGIGLTPSGDDFITGYLAGLWCTSWRTPERRVFLSAAAELVIGCSAQTNDIARTYLLLAARGQVSRRLVDLADAIGRGADAASVVPTARAAMRMGHSSGVDTVTGLLLGLAAWDRPGLVLPM